MGNDTTPSPQRGMTPAEAGRYLHVSPDFIRDEIRAGRMGAIDTSRCRLRRPRYVILPHHLEAWERLRAATATAKTEAPKQRKRNKAVIDFYPD
jgi:hypothetical protein